MDGPTYEKVSKALENNDKKDDVKNAASLGTVVGGVIES